MPLIYDYDKDVFKLKKILLADIGISNKKKTEIIDLYTESDRASAADFTTEIIFFTIHRKKASQGTSVSVEDIILNCNVPKPCAHFCGRNDELKELHSCLCNNSNVFIRGIAGIGKSEFMKFYAKAHKNDYANIIYIMYSSNLQNDIINIKVIDDNPSDKRENLFNKHFGILQSLKNDSLLIIDNFDTSADKEKLLDDILKLKCKALFTTRYSYEGESVFELSEMPDIENFLDISRKIYSDTDSNIDIIKEIINAAHKHTLSFEMSIKLISKGKLKPDEILVCCNSIT